MVIGREPGEWFLSGTMAAFSGPPPYGWVERIDKETMQPLVESALRRGNRYGERRRSKHRVRDASVDVLDRRRSRDQFVECGT